MTEILHVIGFCPDTHSHFDLIDALFAVGGVGYLSYQAKLYLKTFLYIVKEPFKSKINE